MSDDHRSIGEVLNLLQQEFPDVTVSKIRFLESQGLIAPERTPSGYRKFYEPDVQRLRWILQQQRDHYLPLKVIKTRLTRFEEQRAADTPEENGDGGITPAVETAPPAPEVESPVAPPPEVDAGPDPVTTGDAVIPDDGDDRGSDRTSVTRSELARLSGLDESVLAELDGYGLLPAPMVVGDDEVYDEQAVVVARLARGFLRHGVEARHLRMYKTFAEREATFVSQLVAPVIRQKNPDARRQARETVSELARLGGGMRAAMLRLALREAFDE